jgi:hypothetical protein
MSKAITQIDYTIRTDATNLQCDSLYIVLDKVTERFLKETSNGTKWASTIVVGTSKYEGCTKKNKAAKGKKPTTKRRPAKKTPTKPCKPCDKQPRTKDGKFARAKSAVKKAAKVVKGAVKSKAKAVKGKVKSAKKAVRGAVARKTAAVKGAARKVARGAKRVANKVRGR